MVVWIIGLSGGGQTTLANEVFIDTLIAELIIRDPKLLYKNI